MACDNCKDDRPDVLRSNICIPKQDPCCEKPCEDCTGSCDVTPEECDCPLGHMTDHCVHYTGCKTFITKLTPGMSYHEVMLNLELVFENIDQFLDSLVNRNQELELRIEKLEELIKTNKNICEDGWE